MVGESLHLFKQKAPDPKKGKGGFFGGHDKPNKGESSPVSEELEGTINRLRVLEERYSNVQIELKVTGENMIKRNKRAVNEIKTLTSDINELKKEVHEIKDRVLTIIKEMQSGAKKEDVNVLKRYIEMWEPMNFVTHTELQEVMDERLGKKK